MSIFDGERSQLGLKAVGGSSAPASNSKSIFAAERANIGQPQQPVVSPEQQRFDHNTDNTFSNMNAPTPAYLQAQGADLSNPPPTNNATPTQPANDDMRTDYPGGLWNPLNDLGHLANSKFQSVVANVGQMLYTPGAGAANVAGLAGAAEQGVSKLIPGIEETLFGRGLQKAATGAATGAPLGAGQYYANGGDDTKEALNQAVTGATLGIAGGVVGQGVESLMQKYAGSKLGDALSKYFSKGEAISPDQPPQPTLALPEGRGTQRMNAAVDRSNLLPNETPIQGQGDIHTFALPESSRYNEIQRIKDDQTLGLPNPRNLDRMNQSTGSVLPSNESPIYGKGDIYKAPTLALNEGSSYSQNINDAHNAIREINNELALMESKRLQAVNDQYNYLKDTANANRGGGKGGFIKDPVTGEVTDRYGTISSKPIWYQKALQDLNSKSLNKKQLYDLAKQHIDEGYHDDGGHIPSWDERTGQTRESLIQAGHQIAASLDEAKVPSGLPGEGLKKELLTFKKTAAKQVIKPIESKLSTGPIETPAQKLQRAELQLKETSAQKRISDLSKPVVGKSAMFETKVGFKKPGSPVMKQSNLREAAGKIVEPKLSDLKAPTKPTQGTLPKSELKFAQTVKESEHTAPELAQRLNEQPLTGKRTSDELNRNNANEYIQKHGSEGAANKILAKQGTLAPHEVTAAQILAKHFSSLGGEANLNKALDIISKTATKGREMGQAIQALSQWNKLDAEGALLQASRTAGRTLTAAEGKPIIAATDRIQQVAATRSLADEVMHIVSSKKAGEAFTEAEKEKIQEFHNQVKQVNEATKPFLPKEKVTSKADETIKKVSEVPPKERTRDQVVSFLDAKADKARARLAASRNKISSTPFDQYADMAIIGASHIAKGIVKLSDFSEQMIKDFGESIKPHINEVFNKATNIFRKENGLPTVQELDKAVRSAIKNGSFTEEQGHQFKAWANEIGHYVDGNMKVEATQDLQKAMNAVGESTLGQKLSTIHASGMLLNITTNVKNVLGNELFNVLQKIDKVVAVPLDMAASKLTGERHIVFKTNNQEQYWRNWVKGGSGGWDGISPNGQFSSMDIHPEVFKSDVNPFKYMQKATGATLQSFDHAAYMRAYGETMGTYATLLGKKQGLSGKALKDAIPDLIKQLDQSIHDISDEAGKFATFQDENLLSKLAVKAKSGLNEYSTGKISDAMVKAGLPEKYSLRGFGAGDVVLKFAKTPANIIMRGLDYSPIGLLRGLGEIMVPMVSKQPFNQRSAILALSRGITGTLGLTGLGYALASVGILTGSASSDKDIQQLDKMTGKGEYKVNWSALERYVMGGLDKDAAKWQQGDNVFDWGWAQPMAISLAMGVNAQQSIAKQKVEGVSSILTTVKDALMGSMQTILQQPLLQGTQQLISGVVNVAKYGSWSGIANIIKGIPASFVPSLSNQARNFSDNTARNTYDPSKLQTAINMIMNKIPGLAEKLPVAYDSLGNAKEQIQNGQAGTLRQGLQSFASPVKPTTYQVSPQAQTVLDLINATGNTQVAPRTPNSYIMVDKKKVQLTPDQYSQVQQQTGQLTQQLLTKLTPMLENPNVKDDIKVKEVIGVLDRVGKQVRANLEKQDPSLKPHALLRRTH
jgi:hypothetical protein